MVRLAVVTKAVVESHLPAHSLLQVAFTQKTKQ